MSQARGRYPLRRAYVQRLPRGDRLGDEDNTMRQYSGASGAIAFCAVLVFGAVIITAVIARVLVRLLQQVISVYQTRSDEPLL